MGVEKLVYYSSHAQIHFIVLYHIILCNNKKKRKQYEIC